jgi:integrase
MPRRKGKAVDRDGIFTRKDRPGKYFGSWIDASGRRRKEKLEASTLQQAQKKLREKKARADDIRVKGYAEPTKDSLASILPRYLKHQKARLTQRSYERTAGVVENQLRHRFGEMQLGLIRRADIEHWVTERAEVVSPASVIKELNCLKHLLGLAVKWEMIFANHALKIEPPKVPAGRVRYLQPGELRAVLAACPDWLRPIVGLAAFTAMRRSEILGLRWASVDMIGNRLMLSQTKNGEARIVHLNALASNVICGQWREDMKSTDRVFPQADEWTADNVSKGFAAVCRRLEIHDFHFHDLRHTAASWLRMSGADIHTVAQVLGHKDLRMAARYQHLSAEFLGAAVGRLDAVFGEPKQLEATAEQINVPSSPTRPQTEKEATISTT